MPGLTGFGRLIVSAGRLGRLQSHVICCRGNVSGRCPERGSSILVNLTDVIGRPKPPLIRS